MGIKGSGEVIINIPALSRAFVQTKMNIAVISASRLNIDAEIKKLETSNALEGGDGPLIREQLKLISEAVNHVVASMENQMRELDSTIAESAKATKGTSVDEGVVAKQTANAGVMRD